MKKGLFYALCLGALAMSASCQKTQQNSTEKGNSVVLRLSSIMRRMWMSGLSWMKPGKDLFGIRTRFAF